jgi:hypothetical protein
MSNWHVSQSAAANGNHDNHCHVAYTNEFLAEISYEAANELPADDSNGPGKHTASGRHSSPLNPDP